MTMWNNTNIHINIHIYRVFLDARILRHCRNFQSNDPQNKIHCVQVDALSFITTKFRTVTDLFTFCHFPKIYFQFILTGLLVLSISVADKKFALRTSRFPVLCSLLQTGWRILSMLGTDIELLIWTSRVLVCMNFKMSQQKQKQKVTVLPNTL